MEKVSFSPKRKYKIVYSRPKGITKRDLTLAVMYMFGTYTMKYSNNVVTTEEELDNEIAHFYFLNKYNLL